MFTHYSETARCNKDCKVQVGIASWDDGSNTCISVKFASKDKNGRVTRNGEVPVEALPQMLEVAIKNGFLTLK